MKFKISLFLSVLLTCILGGCAGTVPINGETRAGDLLKSDTTKQIAVMAKIYAKCEKIDSIQTQALRTNPVGTGKTAASLKYGSVEERWSVKLCEQTIPFLVTFTPDGVGGTFISSTREK